MYLQNDDTVKEFFFLIPLNRTLEFYADSRLTFDTRLTLKVTFLDRNERNDILTNRFDRYIFINFDVFVQMAWNYNRQAFLNVGMLKCFYHL